MLTGVSIHGLQAGALHADREVLRRALGDEECRLLCPGELLRVLVPEICEKQIDCVKYVRETCVRKVPYTVCRMVAEQRVKS